MTHCPNCTKFHKVCNAICCGPVPIDRTVFQKNFYLIQRPIKETIDAGKDVLPITEDLRCPFLSSSFECMIYNDRPDVCRKFGDETHPMMTCAFQTKSGEARSEKETERLIKSQSEDVDKRIKKWWLK